VSARSIWSQAAPKFQHARTHLAFGERLRRAQRRRDARIQLRTAAEVFSRLDTRPWAERAQAELRASGQTMTNSGGVSSSPPGTSDRPARLAMLNPEYHAAR
jgi:hypothetical protein